MRYITAAVWCALFGEIIGYLVGQMTGVDFQPGTSALVTVIVGEAALIMVPALSGSAKDTTEAEASK
ncbi:YjzD family protein [Fructobacillus ficulneus]|uniref:DUF2929 family protein n=1 Tax=Fructobacillus ficulneus TaxID=157463 RepID=A0A0K8MIM1_9LACO|nr:YjzD family protein [Fructobacillus ficulneus]GAP00406.1 hypothetical protein FFIC_284230 [Fructobacillus ficulneus]